MVVGIVLGSLVGLGLLGAALWRWYETRRSRGNMGQPRPQPTIPSSSLTRNKAAASRAVDSNALSVRAWFAGTQGTPRTDDKPVVRRPATRQTPPRGLELVSFVGNTTSRPAMPPPNFRV